LQQTNIFLVAKMNLFYLPLECITCIHLNHHKSLPEDYASLPS
jgi:hypothetical protein